MVYDFSQYKTYFEFFRVEVYYLIFSFNLSKRLKNILENQPSTKGVVLAFSVGRFQQIAYNLFNVPIFCGNVCFHLNWCYLRR